jgi:hypothetical protein
MAVFCFASDMLCFSGQGISEGISEGISGGISGSISEARGESDVGCEQAS